MEKLFQLLAAGTVKIDPNQIGINNQTTDPNAALSGILNIAYGAAGILCVVVIIIAGIMYVTSDGDASNIKRAKTAIISAVTGLLVIIMAFAITQFILGRF